MGKKSLSRIENDNLTKNLLMFSTVPPKTSSHHRHSLHDFLVLIPTALLTASRSPPPNYSTVNSPTHADADADVDQHSPKRKKPPDVDGPKRRLSVTFADRISYRTYTFFSPATAPPPPAPPAVAVVTSTSTNTNTLNPSSSLDPRSSDDSSGINLKCLAITSTTPTPAPAPGLPPRAKSDDAITRARALRIAGKTPEAVALGFLWVLYLGWLAC